ncbi:MAG: hypothetical protein FWD61_16970 [Phycisphaerales bacterium]|nr:hypothetical protein [Phycisphaerales bacterium]
MHKENLILDYDSSPPTATKIPTIIQLIVLLFILPALAQPFVAYVGTRSPLNNVIEFFRLMNYDWYAFSSLALFGLMFCMGIPLVHCHLRALIFGELSKIEIWAGYIVATFGMVFAVEGLRYSAITLYLYEREWVLEQKLDLLALIVPTVVLAFGVFIVWLLGKRISHDTRVCACLCIPYVVSLLHWVIYDVNSWLIDEIGRWSFSLGLAISLSVIVGTLIEITTLTVMAFQQQHPAISDSKTR